MMAAKTKPLITITIFSQGSSGTFSRPLHTFSISLINSLILTLCGFGVLTTAIIISLISHLNCLYAAVGECETEPNTIWFRGNVRMHGKLSTEIPNKIVAMGAPFWIGFCGDKRIRLDMCFDECKQNCLQLFQWFWLNYFQLCENSFIDGRLQKYYHQNSVGARSRADKFINLIIYTWKMGTKEHLNVIRNFLDCQ